MKKYQLALIGTLAALAISAKEYIPPLSDYISSHAKPTLNYPAYRDLRADRQARELEALDLREKRIKEGLRDMDCLTAIKYDQILRDFEEEADELLKNIKE